MSVKYCQHLLVFMMNSWLCGTKSNHFLRIFSLSPESFGTLSVCNCALSTLPTVCEKDHFGGTYDCWVQKKTYVMSWLHRNLCLRGERGSLGTWIGKSLGLYSLKTNLLIKWFLSPCSAMNSSVLLPAWCARTVTWISLETRSVIQEVCIQ